MANKQTPVPDFYAGDAISVTIDIVDENGNAIVISGSDVITAAFVKPTSYNFAKLHDEITIDLLATGTVLANGRVVFEVPAVTSANIAQGPACIMLKSTVLGKHILSAEQFIIASAVL